MVTLKRIVRLTVFIGTSFVMYGGGGEKRVRFADEDIHLGLFNAHNTNNSLVQNYWSNYSRLITIQVDISTINDELYTLLVSPKSSRIQLSAENQQLATKRKKQLLAQLKEYTAEFEECIATRAFLREQ